MRSATPGQKSAKVVAGAALFLSSLALLFLSLTTLTACEGPCQRHSDCPSQWICGQRGFCEPETIITADPPDASDNGIRDLPDGALDDSDLTDPPDAGT